MTTEAYAESESADPNGEKVAELSDDLPSSKETKNPSDAAPASHFEQRLGHYGKLAFESLLQACCFAFALVLVAGVEALAHKLYGTSFPKSVQEAQAYVTAVVVGMFMIAHLMHTLWGSTNHG